MIMSPQQAFDMISKAWEESKKGRNLLDALPPNELEQLIGHIMTWRYSHVAVTRLVKHAADCEELWKEKP